MRFVVVVLVGFACRTPPEQSPQPRAADAGVDVSYDAAIAPDASTVVFGPCDWRHIDPRNPRCAIEHMPLMPCRDVNGPSNRFPKCIKDKVVVELPKPVVLAIKRFGAAAGDGRLPIIVDGGANHGINDRWRAEVIGTAGKVLLQGSATIVRVDSDEIEVLTKLSADEARELAASVRFSPPKP